MAKKNLLVILPNPRMVTKLTPDTSPKENPWRFNVAPMIDVTDRHCRYLLRLLSKNTRLYTEMISSSAIIHGDREYLLGFSESELPLALQIGGNDPEQFAKCAPIIYSFHYNEVNINVGCPSERVQSGQFGACLMKDPGRLRDCFEALKENSELPVTIKCRIGVDDLDNDEFFMNFIESLANAGCTTFIVHARIALLKGLSPKENRSIPPLNYERVAKAKKCFPHLNIILNGGITNIEDSLIHLETFDGVMLGREIYKNPYLLSEVDHQFFNEEKVQYSRSDIVHAYIEYAEKQIASGIRTNCLTRHLVGLFHEQKFARQWRHLISSNKIKTEADLSLLLDMAYKIEQENIHEELIVNA